MHLCQYSTYVLYVCDISGKVLKIQNPQVIIISASINKNVESWFGKFYLILSAMLFNFWEGSI